MTRDDTLAYRAELQSKLRLAKNALKAIRIADRANDKASRLLEELECLRNINGLPPHIIGQQTRTKKPQLQTDCDNY